MENLQNADIEKAIKEISAKQSRIENYNNYYKGNHALNFAGQKFKNVFGKRFNNFSDNLLKIPVNAPADRLRIETFSGLETDIEETVKEIFARCGLPSIIRKIHIDIFKTREAYAVVYLDSDGKPRYYHQKPEFCHVWKDEETGRITMGAKMWRGSAKDSDFVYITLYYTDRTEKYISKTKHSLGNYPKTAAGFDKRIVTDPMTGEKEPFPLKNETGICPMFYWSIEQSVLDDLIPLNNAVNKTITDALVISEDNARRKRWTTGIKYLQDAETGKDVVPFDEEDDWVTTGNELGKFGEFTTVSVSDVLTLINDFRVEIARVSGIPIYYFMLDKGSFPSGEALTKAESRFTSMIQNSQDDFGGIWADSMRFAIILSGATFPEGELVTTKWKPAEPVSLTSQLDNGLKKKNIGVSEEQIQREIGYTAEEIEFMKGENEAKAKTAAENFGAAFDRGGTDPLI